MPSGKARLSTVRPLGLARVLPFVSGNLTGKTSLSTWSLISLPPGGIEHLFILLLAVWKIACMCLCASVNIFLLGRVSFSRSQLFSSRIEPISIIYTFIFWFAIFLLTLGLAFGLFCW